MIEYILKTLQQDGHVFIERIGSFRTQLRHAEIENGMIYPPHYEVVFSPEESEENNFALANQISRDQQCLFTEANEKVTAWVGELLSALQHNKSVAYEGFGTFMLDKKGNLSFASDIIPQLNSLFEGMEAIDLSHVGAVPLVPDTVEAEESNVEETPAVAEDPKVEDTPVVAEDPKVEETPAVVEEIEKDEVPEVMEIAEPVEEPVEVKAENEEPAQNIGQTEQQEEEILGERNVEAEDKEHNEEEEDDDDDENNEEEDDDDDDDDDDEEEEKKPKRHWAWLWLLLLILVAAGVLAFVFKDKLKAACRHWKERKQPVEQVESAPETPAEAAAFEEPVAEPEAETVEETEPETTEPRTVAPAAYKQTADGKYDYIRFEKGRYYAIAGSFPAESDVLRHIRQKNLDQYGPKIVVQDGVKNLRVCIGVFDTEEEAERFAKGVNQGYWVLK